MTESPSYYANRREDVVPFIPPACVRLLDVGCASGQFGVALKEMRGQGLVVHGVESRPEIAKAASRVLDDVYSGRFDVHSARLLSKGQPYDCIVFNDVLEHMEWPNEAVEVAREILSDAGVVVASIPNFRNWETLNMVLREGTFRYADKGVLDRTHLRFFCRSDIEQLFANAGFEIEQLVGISSLNVQNWQRWHLASRILGNRLAEDGRYKQFVVVARPHI